MANYNMHHTQYSSTAPTMHSMHQTVHMGSTTPMYPGAQNVTYVSYGSYMTRNYPVKVCGLAMASYWAYVIIGFGVTIMISGIIMASVEPYCFDWEDDDWECEDNGNGLQIGGIIMAVIGGIMVLVGVIVSIYSFKSFKKYKNEEMERQQAALAANQPQQAPNPSQQQAYPTQPQAYPTQPQAYPTQPQAYPTQPHAYLSQSQTYMQQSQGYPQAPPSYNAQSQMPAYPGPSDAPPPYNPDSAQQFHK